MKVKNLKSGMWVRLREICRISKIEFGKLRSVVHTDCGKKLKLFNDADITVLDR